MHFPISSPGIPVVRLTWNKVENWVYPHQCMFWFENIHCLRDIVFIYLVIVSVLYPDDFIVFIGKFTGPGNPGGVFLAETAAWAIIPLM
jgi:hypothetical protein